MNSTVYKDNMLYNAYTPLLDDNYYYQNYYFNEKLLMPTTTTNTFCPDFMMPQMDMNNTLGIDIIDKFIAEHEAALNSTTTPQTQPVKINWSHWTFSKDNSPELSESTSSTTSSMSSNKKPIKGRRGRGKGIKNKPVEGALYVCQHENCGRSFTRPYNLTSHMKTHTTERPFACSTCGRKFARQHDRNRHEKLHLGIRPYACAQCHKSFARMDALNRHLRMENGCTSHIHL